MLRIAVLVAVVACGGGIGGGADASADDVHTRVPCDASWGIPGGECELACRSKPTGTPVRDSCIADLSPEVSTIQVDCGPTFVLLGREGCCVDNFPDHPDMPLFAECE